MIAILKNVMKYLDSLKIFRFVRIVKFGDEFSSITKIVSAFNVSLLLKKIMSLRMKSSKEV